MMTKEDIKKAFDICCSAQKSCNGCPLLGLEKQNGRGCKYNLFTSVFDLVNEQEKEIERLKAENEELRNEKWDAQDDLDCYYDEMPTKIKQAKIDVLNKLKDYVNQLACDEYGDSACDTNYVTIDIDKYEQDIDEMIAEVQNGGDKC